ncbi:MAG: hypothetical protein AB7U20_24205 [Planctomycetaceae bacterium]
MADPQRSRLASLERRVERLTSVLMIQSVLLAVVVLMSALRAAPILTLCVIIAIPLLVFYRQSLPQWLRSLGGFVKQLRGTESASAERNRARTPRTPVN